MVSYSSTITMMHGPIYIRFTYSLFSNSFKHRAYEIVWKNIEEPEGHSTMRCMSIACCVPKATNSLLKYVKLTVFPLQQCLHKHTSVLRYTYIACVVKSICKDRLPITKSHILNFSLTSFVSSANLNSPVIMMMYYNSNQDVQVRRHGSLGV